MSLLTILNEGSTRVLELNRPDKRNALNDELIVALKDALRDADGHDSLRAVIIRGAGKDFCSGADLSALQRIATASYEENLVDARSLGELYKLIRKVRLPVIGAVHGRALAGGCGLATACDLVVATKTARFGYPEVKIGFVPAMVTAILRRNLGEKKSFELLTQGFEYSAEDAVALGLVNKIVDDGELDAAAQEMAAAYTSVSVSAVAMTKSLIYDVDGLDFEAAIELGAKVNADARMSEDCRKGIAKFLEK